MKYEADTSSASSRDSRVCFSANCLSVGEEFVFIGCAEGIVRCFSPITLQVRSQEDLSWEKILKNIFQFVTTLPRTHYLGVDVSKGLTISHMASHPNNAQYPDASSVSYDEQNARVTVVYNDHSLYIWDVKDIRKVIINISQEEASVSWRHSRVIGFHSMESQRSAKRAAICNTRLRVRKKCNCYIQLTTQSTRTKADRNDQAILLFTIFTDFRNTAVLYTLLHALLWNI